jgi:hypothetical protein
MTVLRDIDVFSDHDIVHRMTIVSVLVVCAGMVALLAWLAIVGSCEVDGLGDLVVVTLVTVASFVAHELVHGLFFRLLGGRGAHVRFGAAAGMLYATCPGLVLSRTRFLVVLLAPTIVLSVVLGLLGPLVGWPVTAIVSCTIHLSGCTGDWEFVRSILSDPRVTSCEDTERGIRLLG